MTVRELFEEVLQVPQHGGDGVPGQSLLQVWTPQGVQDHPTEGTNITPSPYQTQRDNFRFDTIEQDYHTQPPH